MERQSRTAGDWRLSVRFIILLKRAGAAMLTLAGGRGGLRTPGTLQATEKNDAFTAKDAIVYCIPEGIVNLILKEVRLRDFST